MACILELHPLVVTELTDDVEWYEERSAGLGNRFLEYVNKKMQDLVIHPERYPVKKGNYREALIQVFPYIIVYEYLKEKNIVFVSYVFHAKRNPSLKYMR
jgi:ParE toxin of type II toxin-antitoxin system, parDE